MAAILALYRTFLARSHSARLNALHTLVGHPTNGGRGEGRRRLVQSSAWRLWSHCSRRACRSYRPSAASGVPTDMQIIINAFMALSSRSWSFLRNEAYVATARD